MRRFTAALSAVLVGAAPVPGAALAQGGDVQARYLSGFPEEGWVPPPAPRYALRSEYSHFVYTRDDVRLSTDLYLPESLDGPLPTILIRTPYNKRGWREGQLQHIQIEALVGAGYAVAVQDVRGKFESEGRFAPTFKDDVDAYDTVDWIIAQDWSNGRVGRYGCSYLGENQVTAAPLRHPAVRALVPQASGGALGNVDGRYRYFGIKNGGVNELIMSTGWFRGAGSAIHYVPAFRMDREAFLEIADLFNPAPSIPDADTWELARHLPSVEIMDEAGVAPSAFEDSFLSEVTDPYWEQFPYLSEGDQIDTPALFDNGWYDYGVAETLHQFNYFKENAVSEEAAENQFAIISPMTHCGHFFNTENTTVGDRELGDSRYNYMQLYIDWFDHWLKDVDNGVTDLPSLQYYVMGREEWRGAEAWPLPETQFTPYYLHADQSANGLAAEGRLSTEPPSAGAEASTFVYDPLDPVPSRGGPLCCTGTEIPPEGAFDQADIQAREDILVFTTPPFSEGLEVTGPLKAVLYVSSDAVDTDFTARITDVYPDGRAFNIQEGVIRARYRDGFEQPVFMEEGEVYRVNVDIQATSNFFRPGHRLRLEISSSSWPRWERNLNTGGVVSLEAAEDAIVATNTIHHGPEHASYVLLPVIPAAEEGAR